MIETSTFSLAALGLIFLLGLRHGLDPDHIAVIDNLTFQVSEQRPALAPWVGTLFAIGHSLSVALVAVGVAIFVPQFEWPAWLSVAVDWAVVALLILVGVLNLIALRRPGAYTPAGWRQAFVPRALRANTHPAAIIAVGAVFGLVFDTATQAAAWGLAASSTAGIAGAAFVALVFAAGMIVTDTADSQIVAALLRGGGDPSRVRQYRRGVGWLIVVLSFGMAGYAIVTGYVTVSAELPDALFTGLGVVMASSVIALLLWNRWRATSRPSSS